MHSGAMEISRRRDDISQFMVHLTRDDEAEWSAGGGSAKHNFTQILNDRKILALKPHCLHGPRLKFKPRQVREQFNVACFTETPLTQIKHLLNLPRKINLEGYGFVFERDFLLQKGAQPAQYFSEYHGHEEQRAAFDAIYDLSVRNHFTGKTWKILPLVNVMRDGHDFSWEREWRVVGGVEFELDDLVCVILPEDEDHLRKQMAAQGIAAIDPEWRHEQVVAELGSQLRRTKQIWMDKLPKPVPKLKLKLSKTGT